MSDDNRQEFFPTVDEIINESSNTTCSECGHQFNNSSACRFHLLKQHSKCEVAGSNEKRIVKRTSDAPRVTMAYYCPDAVCLVEKKWFDGWRNMKQHYLRTHAEKSFVCDMCGFKTGLEKDLTYHRKVRCSWMKKRKSDKKTPEPPGSKKRNKKDKSPPVLEEEPIPQPSTSTHTVLQPIFFIVNPENVHSVMEAVQKSLNNGSFDLMSAEASTQVQMPPYIEEEMQTIPMYSTAATSTSFATQYEEPPVTFCERGTMMNEPPLSYFSPPYGAEFGDMTPQLKDPQFVDYNQGAGPSTSSSSISQQQQQQQPQTRSFGTMFENVTTCNTGTSMIDESYVSEFLRDIETQTPNYMIQEPSGGSTSTAPSTSSNNWQWPPPRGDI